MRHTRATCLLTLQQYDRQLVDIKYNPEGVTAVFANRHEATGSLLVGCDGPKSAVRNLLVGADKGAALPLSEIIHCNISHCYGDAEKAKFLRTAHPGMCYDS